MEKRIRPLSIEIDEKLWMKYKEMIPRTIRLNDSIVALIEKEVSKRFKKNSKRKKIKHDPDIILDPQVRDDRISEADVNKEAKEVGTDHDF